MLDVLVIAMGVVVVVLAWSIYQVKYRRRLRASQVGPGQFGRWSCWWP